MCIKLDVSDTRFCGCQCTEVIKKRLCNLVGLHCRGWKLHAEDYVQFSCLVPNLLLQGLRISMAASNQISICGVRSMNNHSPDLKIGFGFTFLPKSWTLCHWAPYKWLGLKLLSGIFAAEASTPYTLNKHVLSCCLRRHLNVACWSKSWRPVVVSHQNWMVPSSNASVCGMHM